MQDFSINLVVLGYLFAGMAHASVLLWLLGHPTRNPMKRALCIWEFIGLLWHGCMGMETEPGMAALGWRRPTARG